MKISIYVDKQSEILMKVSDVPRVGDECVVNNKQCYCHFVVTRVRWELSDGSVVLYGKSV